MASGPSARAEGVQLVSAKDIYSKVLPRHERRRTVHEATQSSENEATRKTSARKSFSIENPTCSPSTASSNGSLAHQSICRRDKGAGDTSVLKARTTSGTSKHPSVLTNSSVGGTSANSVLATEQPVSHVDFYMNTGLQADSHETSVKTINTEKDKTKAAPPKPPRHLSKEEWCPLGLAKSSMTTPGTTDVQSYSEPSTPESLSLWRQNQMSVEEGEMLVEHEVPKVPVRQDCADDVARGYVYLSQSKNLSKPDTAPVINACPVSQRHFDKSGCSPKELQEKTGTKSVSVSMSCPMYGSIGHGRLYTTHGFCDSSQRNLCSRKPEANTSRDLAGGDELSPSKECTGYNAADLPNSTKHASSPERSVPAEPSTRIETGESLKRQDTTACSKRNQPTESFRCNESSSSDDTDSLRSEPGEHIICTDDSLTVLHTCGACLQTCPDPRLLLCFHVVCPACVLSGVGERGDQKVIVCAVCQSEHTLPPEGPVPLADLFPGLLTENLIHTPRVCSHREEMSVTASGTLGNSSGESPVLPQQARSAGLLTQDFDLDLSSRESTKSQDRTLCPSPRSTGDAFSDNKDLGVARDTDSAGDTGAQLCGACRTRSDICHTCVTCGGIMLCEGCRMAHLTLPVTRSHEVLPASSASVSPLVLLARRQPTCLEHGQDIALTCCTCGVFLCHRCLTPHHTRHEIKELASVHHANRKQLTTLQRTIKQHVLGTKSARRSVEKRLSKMDKAKLDVCEAVRACAQHCIQRITAQAEDLTRDVEQTTAKRRNVLEENRLAVLKSQREGQKLRCLLGALTDRTPHLTTLTLLNTCQARYDALSSQVPHIAAEFEDIVFCKDARLDVCMERDATLGNIRTVSNRVTDTALAVIRTFKVCAGLSGLAVTPYGEVVCISRQGGLCQVWNVRGNMLLDASRHVQQPAAVQVLTNGVIVLLDADASPGSDKGGNCCLKMLSPTGSLLSKTSLTSTLQCTKIHCPDDKTILISDEIKRNVILYSTQKNSNALLALRVVTNDQLLRAPRHVTVNISGDWVVSDGGATLQVISPSGDISTLLSSDEFDAALQPPRQQSQHRRLEVTRLLADVCCDSRGHVIAADMGKYGIYVISGGVTSNREQHFVLLKGLAPSTYVTSLCGGEQDKLFVGMADGTVSVLKITAAENAGKSACTFGTLPR